MYMRLLWLVSRPVAYFYSQDLFRCRFRQKTSLAQHFIFQGLSHKQPLQNLQTGREICYKMPLYNIGM